MPEPEVDGEENPENEEGVPPVVLPEMPAADEEADPERSPVEQVGELLVPTEVPEGVYVVLKHSIPSCWTLMCVPPSSH